MLLKKPKEERKTPKALITEEINETEALWLNSLQRSFFADHKYLQWQERLGLFVDESGLIRCKGRIEHADVPYSSRYPVLLPNSHPFPDLLILVCHWQVAHNGVKERYRKYAHVSGLSEEDKWLDEFCSDVVSVDISKETLIRLPEVIVRDDLAFTSVGVDFADPFFI